MFQITTTFPNLLKIYLGKLAILAIAISLVILGACRT